MDKISIIYPYYNNLKCVKDRFNKFNNFCKETLENIEVIFIDDCSNEMLNENIYKNVNFNFTLLRILTDICWNQSGAHNLGVKESKYDWLLFLDIDHWLNEEDIKYLINMKKSNNNSFYFKRKIDDRYKKEAPNIYMIHREKFLECGYYDEDFAGYYGYEDKLLQDIIHKKTKHIILNDVIVNIDNAPTKKLDRNTDRNKKLLNEKKELIKKNKYINNNILRFKWKIIYKGELK